MAQAWRVFWGALIGMALVVLFHPITHPYVSQAFTGFEPYVSSVRPDSTTDGREPGNAYGLQRTALDLFADHHPAQALAAWHRAALSSTGWNDHQYQLLAGERTELDRNDGGRLSWHSALALNSRSDSMVQSFGRLSQALLRLTTPGTAAALSLQADNVRNGVLIRDNSHRLGSTLAGVGMIEGVYAKASPASVRKTITARYALIDQMRQAGMSEEAKVLDDAFRGNDDLSALDAKAAARENESLSVQSILLSKVAATWIWSLLIAGVLVGLGWGLGKVPLKPIEPAVTFILASGCAWITQMLAAFPALTAAVFLAGVLGIFRSNKRTTPDVELSYTLQFIVAVAAGALATSIGYVLVVASSANRSLALDEPALQFLPSFGLVLGSLLFLVLLLCAHITSWITRYPTLRLYAEMLYRMGRFQIVLSLLGLIFVTPAIAWMDHQVDRKLDQIFINEPQYYLRP